MKKFSLFALAAAGLLLGACSSDKDEIVAEPDNLYGMVEGESSWLAIGISMPGDPVTRANEDLIDGEVSEYEVKSGTLYLFKGATEDAATFYASYPINTTFSKESNDNVPEGNSEGDEADGFGEITSTSQKMVQEIENPQLGTQDKLWAYVILNDKGNATEITATKGSTTGAAFKQQQLQAIGIADETKGFGAIGSNGLVMTNVPIATVAGGLSTPADAKILTFTEIDKSAIYKTKAEAQKAGNQSACIYVERAAVKIEVDVDANFAVQLDGQETATTIATGAVKWALGNVNYGGKVGGVQGKGYYNTRQFDTDWLPYNNLQAVQPYLKWRMVGRTQFFDENHSPIPAYRTYFGKDPNYTGTGTIPYDANDGLINAQLEAAQYTLVPGGYTYTYENTFDENSQIFKNTTYIGVQVALNANKDFYTMEGQPNTMLADADAIAAVVSTRLRDVINQKKRDINDLITADLGKAATDATRKISTDVTSVTYDITIAVELGTRDDETGEQPYTVTLAMDNVKVNGGSTPSAEDEAAIKAFANGILGEVANPTSSKAYKYVGGISYYTERIKHFGDMETPWSAPAEAYNVYQDVTKPCIYPANGSQTFTNADGVSTIKYGDNHANAWLGRWGIVRNNWYVLKLKKIEGIGSPVPEDFSGKAGNTPDDNPPTSYFISAEIHILPWVKRYQEITF